MARLTARASIFNRIHDRRQKYCRYIERMEPVRNRLVNIDILCGAVVVLLTGTSAVGGTSFLDALGLTDPGEPAWRAIIGIAALLTLLSTIAAQLYKQHQLSSRLEQVQKNAAQLEGLETLLEMRLISPAGAAKQYNKYIGETPYVGGSKLFSIPSSLDWVEGNIQRPKSGSLVKSKISCSGKVEDWGEGHHLWLAVESEDGHIWPKEGEIRVAKNGSWKMTVFEDGRTPRFSLSLFVADQKANKKIVDWLKKGKASGKYKKMRILVNTRRLDRIEGLHRKI
jgi:hypothetical protein